MSRGGTAISCTVAASEHQNSCLNISSRQHQCSSARAVSCQSRNFKFWHCILDTSFSWDDPAHIAHIARAASCALDWEQTAKGKLHANSSAGARFRLPGEPTSSMTPTAVAPIRQFSRTRRRPRAILDRLDLETVTRDKSEDRAAGVTNTHQPAVRFNVFRQTKTTRFPFKLLIGVGALTASAIICGKNACHGRRTRRRIFTIHNKPWSDRCPMAEV
jgi:hypothetical protein